MILTACASQMLHCSDICVCNDAPKLAPQSFRPSTGVPVFGLRERTEHLDIFPFFRPSLNGVLFPMFCLLVEGECQILVLKYY